MKTVAIVNPVAGLRRAPLIWPRLLAARGTQGPRVTTWWTETPGHAEILAARARREGFARVVAVGGDGTLLEVVNGLWWESQGPLPSVGTVPLAPGAITCVILPMARVWKIIWPPLWGKPRCRSVWGRPAFEGWLGSHAGWFS